MQVKIIHKFEKIISLENLLEAWKEFLNGKRNRKDIQEFSVNLVDNILSLHHDLANKTYQHSLYHAFNISDPKPRNIHKASVKDRLLHHAIYRALYPFFDKIFIADSYSCRLNKGTHKAINRYRTFAYKVSHNYARTVWVLKCDIKKFFASIDHTALLNIVSQYILDDDILWLISKIVSSFYSTEKGKGLPLGNLTSQLFVNVYMNELDQFVKHNIKAKYYIRYADDFVFLSHDKVWLENTLIEVRNFLWDRLRLQLHPNKVSISTVASGIDFLGWVNFPRHKVLRTKTKRRMMSRIEENPTPETLASYLGLLKHGNTFKLQQDLRDNYWLWEE